MSFPVYADYKDSGVPWLGRVPKQWEISPLKRLVEIQNGADYKHVEQEDGYPVIGSGGPFTFASEYLYDGESVLLGRKGTIDKPLHVMGRFWTVDTMYWSKIRHGVSGRFSYYTALSIPFSYYSTSTALPSMTQGALNSHLVALPSEAEQFAIANFLDRETAKIDALVAEQERLISLLKEKRQAVISHAVTKGLNPNAPMKDSGIEWLGEIPVHWEATTLRRCCRSVQTGGTPSSMSPAQDVVGVPWFTPGDFKGLRLQSATKNTTVETINDGECRLFPLGSVLLVSIGATLGKVGIPSVPCSANQQINAVVPLEKLSTNWLALSLSVATDFMKFISNASTIGIMNQEKTKEIPIALPPLDEQARVVDYLEQRSATFDTLIAEAQSAITLLQERRAALISAAVTGKIDVRGVVEPVREHELA